MKKFSTISDKEILQEVHYVYYERLWRLKRYVERFPCDVIAKKRIEELTSIVDELFEELTRLEDEQSK